MRFDLIVSSLAWAAVAFARAPFAPADLELWRTIEDPRISADGRQVVYVERWNGRANLRLVSTPGQPPRALTDGPWCDRSPRWSPDGARIAYLSDRGGARGIRTVTLADGALSAIATRDYQPLALAWSPDGRSIAFTAATAPRAAVPSWAPPELLSLLRAAPYEVDLFVVPIAGGAPRRLSHGGFTLRGEPAWMPAGDWILDDAAPPAEGSQIFAVRAADGETRRLTEGPGFNRDPLPSPDGTHIVWICTDAEPAFHALRKLCVMGRDGGHRKVLAGRLDRDARQPQWSSEARTVYFLADDHGATHVYAARGDGAVRQVTNREERLEGFSLADNGRAVAVRSNATEGGNLVAFAVDLPGGVVTLAEPNQPLLAQRDIGGVEEIRFESAGNTVQAWLVRPPNVDRARALPLIVEVSGEPRTMFGYEFPLEAHILAASGYAVLRVNPRGSPGYGEAFGNLLATRLPGDDFDDTMRGVDAAIKAGGIDAARVALVGGAVAAWALGHTGRFAAVVARRPIVDWTSDIALSGDGWRHAAWLGGMPWEQANRYVDRSPIYAAAHFAAPTLVIGGDAQSQELYFALQARKLESALLTPPGGSPSCQEEGCSGASSAELSAILAWFGRWLKPDPTPHP